jgi:hypothetical protein
MNNERDRDPAQSGEDAPSGPDVRDGTTEEQIAELLDASKPVRIGFRGIPRIKGCEVMANNTRIGRIIYDPDGALRWVLEIDNVLWDGGLPSPVEEGGSKCIRAITELSAKRLAYTSFPIWFRAFAATHPSGSSKKEEDDGDGDIEEHA